MPNPPLRFVDTYTYTPSQKVFRHPYPYPNPPPSGDKLLDSEAADGSPQPVHNLKRDGPRKEDAAGSDIGPSQAGPSGGRPLQHFQGLQETGMFKRFAASCRYLLQG